MLALLRPLFRIVFSALCVLSIGYSWTVGQSGLDTTNTNLCDLARSAFSLRLGRCEVERWILWLWTAFVAVCACYLLYEAFRFILGKPLRRRIAMLWLIVAFFGIGLGAALFVLGRSYAEVPQSPVNAPTAAPKIEATEFVKNQGAARQWTQNPGDEPCIEYWAQFVSTGQQRLRFFLERTRLGNFGPIAMGAVERMPLGEVRDYIKDDNVRFTLVTRRKTSNSDFLLWWGDKPDGLVPFDMNSNYAARVTVLSDNGKEQHFYFFIFVTHVNQIPFPEVFKADTLDIMTQWAARDAKR